MSDRGLLVFIGPSGVGKSSVVRTLQTKQLLHFIPSWTTRTPRIDEQGGKGDHIFISEEEFNDKIKSDFFLGEAALFGLPYRYGLPRFAQSTDKITAVILRAPLLPLFSKHYDDYLIYQIEDSYKNISKRLNKRQERGEDQGERLSEYAREIAMGRQTASRVFINDASMSDLATQIEASIKADFGVYDSLSDQTIET